MHQTYTWLEMGAACSKVIELTGRDVVGKLEEGGIRNPQQENTLGRERLATLKDAGSPG